MEARTYLATLRQYFSFNQKEWKALIIGALVIGFIFSFRSWGEEVFNPTLGLFNLFNGAIIAFLALLVHVSAQKLVGLRLGHDVKYNLWIYGILIALVVCLITRGRLWLFTVGGVGLIHLTGHRIGYFRYWSMNREKAGIAFVGPFASLALAFIFKGISYLPVSFALVDQAIAINIWLAFFTMLPVPPLDGGRLLMFSRLWYFFLLGIVAGLALALLYLNFLSTILIGILCGVIFWGICLAYLE